MSWQPTYPKYVNQVKDVPALVQANWVSINAGLSGDHGTSAPLHKWGMPSILFRGTTTEIQALTPPGTGAIAYDTDLGIFVIHNGLVWQRIGLAYWPRSRAYLSSAVSLSGSQTGKLIVFDSENYDSISNYDTASGYFTVASSGTYIVMASVATSGGSVGGTQGLNVQIYKSSSASPVARVDVEKSYNACSSPYPTLNACYIGYLATGETLSVQVDNPNTNSIWVIAGATSTYFTVHRLPWTAM